MVSHLFHVCSAGVFVGHVIVLDAPDSVLSERHTGRRIDPETEGEFEFSVTEEI
jgi:hypothetical protein